MDKLIMKFLFFIDNSKVSNMSGPYGAVTVISFTGKAESELFTGEILPGAADIQVENDPYFNACPTFLIDSPVLGAYLCQARFRSEVHGTDTGVEMRIFDVCQEGRTI